MELNYYNRFRGQKLTLSDYLAIDRTVLANERTALAYARTALAMAVVGGTCIKFFEATWIRLLGIAFVALGALIAARGWQRYRRTQRLLAAALEQETGAPGHPLNDAVSSEKETSASKEESAARRPAT